MKGYPRWFMSALVTGSGLLYATGLLLGPTTLEMRAAWAPAWRLPADTRLGMAALHATLGLLMMVALGALWSVHMRAGWRKRRQRGSGLLLAAALLWLAITAVGVYYLADEFLANVAGLSHLAVGGLLLLPFAWHALKGHRRRTRRDLPGQGPSCR
jgi:hypothetical protein